MKAAFAIYGTMEHDSNNIEGFKQALINRLLFPSRDKSDVTVTHIDIMKTANVKPRQELKGLFLNK